MLLTILTGALAGVFHVLSGPDHLAAVAPLAALDRARGWLAGWTWGLGHAAGVVVVAMLAVVLRNQLPSVETLSAVGERVVGVALIALGLWGLRRSARIRPTAHVHGALRHDHMHVQAGPSWFRRLGHAHASFCLGVLHGIAGSSHFFGVLPALALPTKAAAFTYITAFGVGSVVSMSAFAAVVGYVGSRTPHAQGAPRTLLIASAVAAIVVGGLWLAGAQS